MIFFSVLAFLCIRHNYIYANILIELLNYTCYDCTLQDMNKKTIRLVVLSKYNLASELNQSVEVVALGDGYKMDVR